jgi:hypothetical protein
MSREEPDMLVSTPAQGYSAQVGIELFFKGKIFRVSQMGRDMLILREPFSAGPGEGEVVLTVDGVPHRWLATIHEQPIPSRIIKADLRESV